MVGYCSTHRPTVNEGRGSVGVPHQVLLKAKVVDEEQVDEQRHGGPHDEGQEQVHVQLVGLGL